jgi:hypothetical protein
MFAGPIMKVAYAFLWQENFISINFAYGNVGIYLQSWESSLYNQFINWISWIEQSGENLLNFENVYPGDK